MMTITGSEPELIFPATFRLPCELPELYRPTNWLCGDCSHGSLLSIDMIEYHHHHRLDRPRTDEGKGDCMLDNGNFLASGGGGHKSALWTHAGNNFHANMLSESTPWIVMENVIIMFVVGYVDYGIFRFENSLKLLKFIPGYYMIKNRQLIKIW